MKVAIMQPYFFPYLGYWQLINAVDSFIVYDNIQYTKKGWFNRNRYLRNGKDEIFSIALKKDSDYLDVNKRFISVEYNRKKMIAQFQNAYAKAPYKKEILPFLENIINYDNDNLFEYIYNSIIKMTEFLDIETNIIISSTVDIDHNLKSKDKVIALCKATKANTYINAIGGQELYDKKEFKHEGLELKFLKMKDIRYQQFKNEFVPNLSIIDVLMFNSKDVIKNMLGEYEIL